MIKELTSDLMAQIFKDVLIKKGYNTMATIKKNLKASTTEPIYNTINTIVSTPNTIKNELKRQSYHEASNLFNIGNYDYFGEYYNNLNKRYDSTPQSNLAELFYIQECNNRRLKGY